MNNQIDFNGPSRLEYVKAYAADLITAPVRSFSNDYALHREDNCSKLSSAFKAAVNGSCYTGLALIPVVSIGLIANVVAPIGTIATLKVASTLGAWPFLRMMAESAAIGRTVDHQLPRYNALKAHERGIVVAPTLP
jgi:hypothetical protein